MTRYIEMTEYQRVCDERDDLRDEIANLRQDLGLATVLDECSRLKTRYGLEPSAAKILLTLYRSSTHVLRFEQVDDVTPATRQFRDRDPSSILKIWVWQIRKRIGRDSIETIWGEGYRLTPLGVSVVARALSEPTARAA